MSRLPKWLLALFAAGIFMFCLAMGIGLFGTTTQKAQASFSVKDPRSLLVVKVKGDKPLLGPVGWDGTISVDGQRPTQYTGWPVEKIARDEVPTAILWHSDPDWVEIVLSSGERLKLTWDAKAVAEARKSKERNYYLAPEFEVLKGK